MTNLKEVLKKISVYKWWILGILALILSFGFGFKVGYNYGYTVGNKAAIAQFTNDKTKEPVKATVKAETQAQIVYVPKTVYVDSATDQEVTESTDVEANIPKTELHVKVNGKETTIQKADNEQYIFDKNKLQLNQQSTATISIDVPAVDNTKTWAVGVGIGRHSNNTYIPVSVQRDYKKGKRAVQVELHLNAQNGCKPNGVEVQHIWRF